MIVAIPVDKSVMEANISDHFGRTEFFLIWNSENEESLFINNDAINAQGGGQSHNNMPPYVVKYCWERTA